MERIFRLKDHPILGLTKKQKGNIFELGEKLENILKRKYKAANNENWFDAAKFRANETELMKKIENILKKLNIEIPRRKPLI